MKVIKIPTGTIAVDEPIKIVTQSEYDAISNKKDGLYLITDDAKNNIIKFIKKGIEMNNVAASRIAFTPSGDLTKKNVQDAITENGAHIKTTNANLSTHINNTIVHITPEERTKWDGKSDLLTTVISENGPTLSSLDGFSAKR